MKGKGVYAHLSEAGNIVHYNRGEFSASLIREIFGEILKSKYMNEKKRLFQYAVIYHRFEIKEGKKEYVDSEVIKEPTIVLAKNEREVLFKAVREVPEDKAADSDNVEVVIRNF